MPQAEDFLDAIAERVEQRLLRSSRMQSQYGSPLGARTHRAAVNRRIDRNEGGAHIVKGRFLLTQQALREELDRETNESLSRRKRSHEPPDHSPSPNSPTPRRGRKVRDQSPELDALQRELTGGLRHLGEVR